MENLLWNLNDLFYLNHLFLLVLNALELLTQPTAKGSEAHNHH